MSSVSRSEEPFVCTAKSTIVVVPPQAAARVPVSKSSAENVPPNGISRWVCTSMPPGMTYWPVASSVWSTAPAQRAGVRGIEQGGHGLAVDEHVGGGRPGRGDHRATADECAHGCLP